MSRSPDRRPIRSLTALVAIALVATLVATGCSNSKSPSSTGGGGASGTTVDVKNFSFSPGTLNVAVGAKVTWKFDDSTQHTVKADDGSFSSSALNSGQTYTFTFNKAGTYSYICSIHTYMKGKIVVQ